MEDKNFDINDLDIDELERLDDESKQKIIDVQLLLKDDPNYIGINHEKYIIGNILHSMGYLEEAIEVLNKVGLEDGVNVYIRAKELSVNMLLEERSEKSISKAKK